MTALAYICLFVGAWTLACSVLRLVDKLEGRGVKKTCRWHVIASQCSHWRGERTERCQWQMKRGERVAAVKILAALMPLQNFGNRNRKSAPRGYGFPRRATPSSE